MILFSKIILGIALLAYPYVVTYKKGIIDFMWNRGILFGLNHGSAYLKGKDKETNEDTFYKMETFQFHLFLLTATMCYTVKVSEEEANMGKQ